MKQIKLLREHEDWTQLQLSLVLDVTVSTIKNWEAGRSRPTMEMRHKINDMLQERSITKILPTKEEIDFIMQDPKVYTKVATVIEDTLKGIN